MTDQSQPDRQNGDGLRTCPCCAGVSSFAEEWPGHMVACENARCGVRSGIFPTRPMARRAWNTRPGPARDAAEGAGDRWAHLDNADMTGAIFKGELSAPPKPAPDAMREARLVIETARNEIVLTIAYLGRDGGTERAPKTIKSLIESLAKADAALRAYLASSAPVPPADGAPEAFAKQLELRANGYEARGTSIFSGHIIADELNEQASRLRALSAPDGASVEQKAIALLDDAYGISPNSAERFKAAQNTAESDPSVMPDCRSAETALSPSGTGAAEPVVWPPYIELPLTFWYKNHRGEESLRTAFPISIRFGTTEYHPEAQWLLKAFDRDKQAEREFAMRDMLATPVRGDRGTAIRAALKAHGYNDRQIDDPDFINESFRRNVEITIDAILSGTIYLTPQYIVPILSQICEKSVGVRSSRDVPMSTAPPSPHHANVIRDMKGADPTVQPGAGERS